MFDLKPVVHETIKTHIPGFEPFIISHTESFDGTCKYYMAVAYSKELHEQLVLNGFFAVVGNKRVIDRTVAEYIGIKLIDDTSCDAYVYSFYEEDYTAYVSSILAAMQWLKEPPELNDSYNFRAF